MWEWKVLIEQLLLVTLSRQKRLQFLFLRFGFGFRFRFRIPAFPYARTIGTKLNAIPDRNCHTSSFSPRVNNFAQLAWLNLTILGHLFPSCWITEKILCSPIVQRGLPLKRKEQLHARKAVWNVFLVYEWKRLMDTSKNRQTSWINC